MIYFCEGNDSEKLDWFKIINIAGEKLTNQELRNAVYSGEWLEDAKKHFSKAGCPAYDIASKYLKGSAIRQDYLETVGGFVEIWNDSKLTAPKLESVAGVVDIRKNAKFEAPQLKTVNGEPWTKGAN